MPNVLKLMLAILALLIVSDRQGYAQATRTWVSGVGDDANPCSRTAPCKTFAGAISKTAAGGEISVLDPGGFGAVTITKSISIVSEGSEGSILAAGTNGIIINSATAVVSLHGLFIEGAGTGLNGIRVLQAASVHIRNCLIRGFLSSATATAIDIEPSTTTNVYVSNCTLSNNRRGVFASPTGAGVANVFLDRVTVEGSLNIAIRGVSAATNIFLNNTVVAGNNGGLSRQNGALITSFGNNILGNNILPGSNPSSTVPPL